MTLEQLRQRLSGRTPGPLDVRGEYAVLVPLTEREGEVCLLYEVRAASLRRQPGEVCFPGGRVEPGEGAQACALRETREELGIPEEDIQLIAPLDFLCHRTGSVLYPFLAWVDTGRLRPGPGEVEEVFFAPLDELRRVPAEEYRYELLPSLPEDFPYERIGIPRDYRWQRGVETGPVYPWRGHAIWGMTGRITRQVLALTREESYGGD